MSQHLGLSKRLGLRKKLRLAILDGDAPYVPPVIPPDNTPVTITQVVAHHLDPPGTVVAEITGPSNKVITTTTSQIVSQPGSPSLGALILGTATGIQRYPEPGVFYIRVKVVANA